MACLMGSGLLDDFCSPDFSDLLYIGILGWEFFKQDGCASMHRKSKQGLLVGEFVLGLKQIQA